MEKVIALTAQGLSEGDRAKVLFLKPEKVYYFMEQQAACMAGTEERIKGYRVETQYQPVRDGEKKLKKEAVAKVILEAMRRISGRYSRMPARKTHGKLGI